jgi:hypothetical protein
MGPTASVVVDYVLAAILGGLAGALIRIIRYFNRPAWVLPKRSMPRYLIVGAAAGVMVLVLAQRLGWTAPHLDWILVALLGAAVGIGELTSRYRDEPTKALLTIPAMIYIALNAAASVMALALGRGVELWTTVDQNTVSWTQVLTAGLGAMVFLRSSVFRIRVGEEDVDVGPSSFLTSVITAADRAVDRVRAQERAWTVTQVMGNVASDKALEILPSYLSALMQNFNQEEQSRFDQSVNRIRSGQLSNETKVLLLGLVAMTHMGGGVLRSAVQSLAAQLKSSAKETLGTATDTMATAQATKEATTEAVAAMEQAATVAETVDVPDEVKQAVAEGTAAVKEAAVTAQATVDQARATTEAALSTVEVVNALAPDTAGEDRAMVTQGTLTDDASSEIRRGEVDPTVETKKSLGAL